MRRTTVITLLSAMLLVICGRSDAFAHGGAYRGPGSPFPKYPSLGGKGPTTGGSKAPSTAGATRGPLSGGGGSPLTATKNQATATYTPWTTWWELNKHRYLNLRARLRSRTAVSGNGRPTDLSGRPGFDELRPAVVPLLVELATDKDMDIADSSLLALARITPPEEAGLIRGALRAGLTRREASVQEAAVLALGVVRDSESVPLLISVLEDSRDGRVALSATQELPDRVRGLAAVSLGLIGDVRGVAPMLLEFKANRSGSDDLRGSILLGLGLFRDPPQDITLFLSSQLENDKLSDVVRAQIPIALMRGHESSRSLLPVLLRALESKKTPNPLKQSCAIALGELADPRDAEVIAGLLSAAENDKDDATSNFSYLALGSVAARAAEQPDQHEEMLKQSRRVLMKGLLKPRSKTMIPWVATAMATLGRELPVDSAERREIEKQLVDSLEDSSSNENRAALAIALGLLDVKAAGKELLARFEDCNDVELTGAYAEALGLIRVDDSAPVMKGRMAKERDYRVRSRIAVALGLLGDLDVAERLVKDLERLDTLYETASVAKTIGIVGDRSALDPLMALSKKKTRSALMRAFACVSLGLLGERTPLPWNARISENVNYLASFPVLVEVLDIL